MSDKTWNKLLQEEIAVSEIKKNLREWQTRNLEELKPESVGAIKVEQTITETELGKAVKELYYWQDNKGEGTNFHSLLYTLFQKADSENRIKLGVGFPNEHYALHLWNEAGDYGNDLFREYGLM